MKKILATLLVFSCLQSFAQIDSASLTLSVQLPVKGIVLYGAYVSEVPSWSERKTPDALLPLIGSGTKPDSLVNVTVKAGTLFTFIQKMLSERYGAIYTPAQSIFNNNPVITGYTGLFSQIVTKANGNTSEKAAATYVVNQYNAYTSALTSAYNDTYTRGVNWIRN